MREKNIASRICNTPGKSSFFHFKLTPIKSAGRDFFVYVCMGLPPGGVDAIQGKEQQPPRCCESAMAWLACLQHTSEVPAKGSTQAAASVIHFSGGRVWCTAGRDGICLNALQLKSILGAAKIWSRGWLMVSCRMFMPGHEDKLGSKEKLRACSIHQELVQGTPHSP